ncbi:hypothetical protein HK102_010550, partial [Quaeritorhiza haematococci]
YDGNQEGMSPVNMPRSDPSKEMLGPGVYITDSIEMAWTYALKSSSNNVNDALICKMYVPADRKGEWKETSKIWIPNDHSEASYRWEVGHLSRHAHVSTHGAQLHSAVLFGAFEALPRTASGHPYQVVFPEEAVEALDLRQICVVGDQRKTLSNKISYVDKTKSVSGEKPLAA